MTDCVYVINGDCDLVMKVSDEMGNNDYIGIIEMNINQVNEYVQMEIVQLDSRMVNQEIVV